MAKPLTEEQRNAILEQSKGMTTEEKQGFADKLHVAQGIEPVANTEIATDTTEIKPQITTELDTGRATEVGTGKVINEGTTEPIKTTEVKTETTPTDTKVEEVGLPQTIADWKTKGSDMNTLEEMIETKYGTVAENVDGTLNAEINGVKYQWTIDDAGNPIKTKVQEEAKTSNDYFADMQAGIPVTDSKIKNTVDYKAAKQRKIDLDKYSGMSANELQISMGNGELLTGTQAYNDLKANNPALLKQAEDLYKLNVVNTGNKGETKSVTQSISDYITNLMNPTEVQAFTAVVSGDETVTQLNANLVEAEAKKAELLDQIEYVEEDFKKDLGNRSVSKAYKNYKIGERTRELTRLANLEISKVNSIAGQIQNRTTDLKYDYEQGKADEVANLNKMKFAYDLYKDQQTTTATKWSKLNDGTLYNESTGETKTIEGVETGATNWTKLDDNTLYNKSTGEFKDKETGTTSNDLVSNPNSIVDYSVNLRGREELQCGELVNDYWTKVTGSRAGMGDTLESKLDAVMNIGESDSPIAGGVFVSNPLGNTVGHTGIIQSVGPDGSINVLEANAGGSENGEKPTIKTYTPEQIKQQGMIFSQKPGTKEEIPKDVESWGQNILKGKAKMSDIASNPELRTQVSNYIANNKPVYTETDPIVMSIDKDIKALDSIVDWDEGGTAWYGNDTTNESLAEDVSGSKLLVSPIDAISGEKGQFLRKIQTVLDSQALKNLIDVKNMGATFGSLTEKEMAILQKSASALNAAADRDEDGNIVFFTMNETEFKDELRTTLETAEKLRASLLGEEDLFDKYY